MTTRKNDVDKDRNEDPISGEPGAHPVGVGKGVAEAIDPTEEEAYWKQEFKTRPYAKKATFDEYRPAYQYGWESQQRYSGKKFDEVETKLSREWETGRGESALSWAQARPAVRDAWDRTMQLREERLVADKERVDVGDVKVRKEIVTEHQTIDVPVEREEVVIERRAVRGKAAGTIDAAEEIRIPVKEERVNVRKETVVNEEVSVGRRKVRETKKVAGTVRKEKLKVEDTAGKATVRKTTGPSRGSGSK